LNVYLIDVNNLRDDPNYHTYNQRIANYALIYRTAKFINLQVRMLPVYRKAVVEMHFSNDFLLFRFAAIMPEIFYALIHTANEYDWHPEPGNDDADRPVLDCVL